MSRKSRISLTLNQRHNAHFSMHKCCVRETFTAISDMGFNTPLLMALCKLFYTVESRYNELCGTVEINSLF